MHEIFICVYFPHKHIQSRIDRLTSHHCESQSDLTQVPVAEGLRALNYTREMAAGMGSDPTSSVK